MTFFILKFILRVMMLLFVQRSIDVCTYQVDVAIIINRDHLYRDSLIRY